MYRSQYADSIPFFRVRFPEVVKGGQHVDFDVDVGSCVSVNKYDVAFAPMNVTDAFNIFVWIPEGVAKRPTRRTAAVGNAQELRWCSHVSQAGEVSWHRIAAKSAG